MAWDSLRFINRDRNLNFFEKGDVHNKSLNKINLVFYRNLDILANITDPNFFVLYFTNVCNN